MMILLEYFYSGEIMTQVIVCDFGGGGQKKVKGNNLHEEVIFFCSSNFSGISTLYLLFYTG